MTIEPFRYPADSVDVSVHPFRQHERVLAKVGWYWSDFQDIEDGDSLNKLKQGLMVTWQKMTDDDLKIRSLSREDGDAAVAWFVGLTFDEAMALADGYSEDEEDEEPDDDDEAATGLDEEDRKLGKTFIVGIVVGMLLVELIHMVFFHRW